MWFLARVWENYGRTKLVPEFLTMAQYLEVLWESLGLQRDKPVNPKGNQSCIFIGRTDSEAESPIPWPPDAKNWFTGKDPDAGNGWRQKEKGTTMDEMVGWHHRLNGHEFEQALGVGDGQGSLECCSHGITQSRAWLRDWTDLTVDYQTML